MTSSVHACPNGYNIEDQIARNGRAIVYKARKKSDNRLVALKLVQNDNTGRHEIDMLRRVSEAHSGGAVHVVRLLGHHEDTLDLWIALEYFSETLDQLDPANMTPLALMNIALDSAKGLVEMEQAGVVDDDVKPGNIAFKARSGRVAHIDLDCARLSGEKPVGRTDAYAAPETLRKEPSDTSPCFSWGRTMEFLAYGRVGLGPDYRLDDFVPWVGTEFAKLIARCGEPNPGDRPSPSRLYAHLKEIVRERRRCTRCNVVAFGDGRCPRCTTS